MFTVPLPIILLGILIIRGVTLPGAMEGIKYYLTPDFSKLADPRVWLAAYSQERKKMPVSGWLMFIIACVVLYGGLVICISIAIKGKDKKN